MPGKTYHLTLGLLLATFSVCLGQQVKSFDSGPYKLFYEEFGEGPPMYILSGGPGESPDHPYRQIVDSLKSSYTCILVHQRGTGLSRDIPINESTIGIEHYTQDLELLRKARGDKKISLLGISWGGMLAMNYAATYPDFASNLILVCSGPPSHRLWNVLYDNQFSRRSVAELDSMNQLQKIFSSKSEKELDSLKIACPDCPEVSAYKEFILFHVRAMYYDRSKVSRALYEKEFYDFNFQVIPIIDKQIVESRFDIREKLKNLEIPALIVYGRQDDQGESTFFEQIESLKLAEVHVIEQCGHEILEEKPLEFFRILKDYVQRTRD